MAGGVHDLERVRYWDTWLNGMANIMRDVADCVERWPAMPGYARAEKLVYLGQLRQHVDNLRGAVDRGELTRRQAEQFRQLAAKVDAALGLVEVLREKHEALEREGEAP